MAEETKIMGVWGRWCREEGKKSILVHDDETEIVGVRGCGEEGKNGSCGTSE